MRSQWDLQKKIVGRYRTLGMTGQLPAFQGNVPIQLKEIQKDPNITQQGGTGWMDALDPLYAKVSLLCVRVCACVCVCVCGCVVE
jgi:hypothetical protein